MGCFNYETNKLLKTGLKAGGLNILYENINGIHADIEVLLIFRIEIYAGKRSIFYYVFLMIT